MREAVDHPSVPASPAPAKVVPAVELVAVSIGYLVPKGDFAGVVHSVFARACNIAVGRVLVTVVNGRDADGPTHVVLRSDTTRDLRQCFQRGLLVNRRGTTLAGHGVTLDLAAARVGSAGLRAPALSPQEVRANVDLVSETMRGVPRGFAAPQSGGGEPQAPLLRAVQQLDEAALAPSLQALVGLGEGLTPAGDDFIVGLLAGLELLADDATRRHVLAVLRHAVEASLDRTNDISAHLLRLAAAGHFSGALDRLRSRVVCEPRGPFVASALRGALECGATSGADTVSGLLAAFRAWLPAPGEGAA